MKKRYDSGGVVSNTNYPFGQGQTSPVQPPPTLGQSTMGMDKQQPQGPLVQINAGQNKPMGMKKGGAVKSASKRADGIATKGKTRGRMV